VSVYLLCCLNGWNSFPTYVEDAKWKLLSSKDTFNCMYEGSERL
jgi:hypothetical protein